MSINYFQRDRNDVDFFSYLFVTLNSPPALASVLFFAGLTIKDYGGEQRKGSRSEMHKTKRADCAAVGKSLMKEETK